jgi:hypothetical protein
VKTEVSFGRGCCRGCCCRGCCRAASALLLRTHALPSCSLQRQTASSSCGLSGRQARRLVELGASCKQQVGCAPVLLVLVPLHWCCPYAVCPCAEQLAAGGCPPTAHGRTARAHRYGHRQVASPRRVQESMSNPDADTRYQMQIAQIHQQTRQLQVARQWVWW